MPEKRVSKVVYHTDSSDTTGTVWMDVTQKTVTTNNMLSGITSLKNDGTDITGNIASKTSSDLTVSGATVTAPAGYYSSNASESVASGTAGTPTATKGTVSNHQVSITPSVTNTTGYITGSTKTGTAVTVTVSELESGTKSITENGTGISVSGYSAVDIAVPTGPDCPVFTVVQNAQTGTVTVTCNKTFSECYTSATDNPSNSVAMLDYKVGDTLIASMGLLLVSISFNNQLKYIINSGQEVPNYEISYLSDGTISYSDASDIFQDLTVTAGGTYPSSGSVGHIAYKTVTVASGSATTPTTSITANPTISVNGSGLITASVSSSQSVTPTVSAGYVSSGTAGTVSVNGSNTSQLTAQAAQTIYPSTSDQTISSGQYLTGTQTIKGVVVTGLTAANIVSGVTVKIGDSADDDRITSVTGTYTTAIQVVRLI